MIDIKLIRENPELIKENIKKKFQNQKLELVDKVTEIDKKWRELKKQADNLRAQRNKISREINQAKKLKQEEKAKELIKKAKDIPRQIEQTEKKEQELKKELNSVLSQIPNIISDEVPIGKDDSENKVEKIIGKPKKFSFQVKSHAEIIEKLGMADFDSSSRVSGTGFYYIEDKIALLNQALIKFGIDKMISKGFRYVETPLLLKEEIIDKVTDLNDKQQQIYTVDDNPKMALIGTSEHSLIGRFAGQEINEKKLPIKQTSYSMCFRKEIGSHGLDEKGLFRTHQFNKIEMIVICHPEQSDEFFKQMQNITVEIFKDMEIPIRILKICSGDLGDLKKIQIDVEAYSPRRKDYFEVGSCSNLTDCQARKLGISTRIKNQRIVPHTLNNTALATSRALVAIIENNQTKQGTIKVPKALHKYTGFKEIKPIIKKSKNKKTKSKRKNSSKTKSK
jgi:seryl-tRNA synthetase